MRIGRNLAKGVFHWLLRRQEQYKLSPYLHRIPALVEAIRKKNKIRVLFLQTAVSKWKTESLFRAMMAHPRFEPMVGIMNNPSDFPSEAVHKIQALRSYLEKKNYPFVEVSLDYSFAKETGADIVFFSEAGFAKQRTFELNPVLFCYVCYCFETTKTPILLNSLYQNACWQYYVENQMLIDYAKHVMDNKARNMVVTGLPMVDELMADKKTMEDPWKTMRGARKRIIWAPHHTIGGAETNDFIHFGSFLYIAQPMLQFAEKYKSSVQFAFKPHPVLFSKLSHIWGEQKASAYFQQWASMENTQLEDGRYVELFKYSDALINDSASFIIEYLYMQKPCLYVENGLPHNFNAFTKMCHAQYYSGASVDDIEGFIRNVLAGIDPRQTERETFFQTYLLPPAGRTASQNIMDAILGG